MPSTIINPKSHFQNPNDSSNQQSQATSKTLHLYLKSLPQKLPTKKNAKNNTLTPTKNFQSPNSLKTSTKKINLRGLLKA
jgi:hypothetical protein